ncbi:MAG: cellulose binding domain-containing protein, partial [Planctomycetota bacterium]
MNGRDVLTLDWFGTWTRQGRRRFSRRLSASAARAGRSLASERLESRAMLAVTPPTISIDDVTIMEQDAGTQAAAITLRLSRAVGVNVTVRYATANGTALAGSDYVAKTGIVTFPAGSTIRRLPITIRGDRLPEPNEQFSVNLSAARGATIADRSAVVTITDNDRAAPPPPSPSPAPAPAPVLAPVLAPALTSPPVSSVAGRVFPVSAAGDDIVGFDPARDQLDFGAVSVHNLILGKLASGEVAFVNPWASTPEYQVVRGITYRDLTIANFGVVQNEHLRQDIGGVVSWEQGVGPRAAGTVYVRSHEYGAQERIEGFDPATTKLSFLYFGTRERLTLTDTTEGLLISVQPTNQSVLLAGVTKSQLVPTNVEFHHDQIVEDQLEVPFGHPAEHFTLVSRVAILTPASPPGEVTDGNQTSIGQMPPADHDHGSMPMPMPPAPAPSPTGSVSFAVTSDWGSGFNGDVTVRNTGTSALASWTVSFDFDGTITTLWNGVIAERSGSRYTVRNEQWNGTLAAGAATSFGFTASPGGASAVLRNLTLVGTATAPTPAPAPA